MLAMIFTLLLILLIAGVIIAIVVMGMEGTGRQSHPEIAQVMAKTAKHLNGDGEPPAALVTLFDEIDEVPPLDVREIPGRLRSAASSARSSVSARSARSATSATSASSAAELEDEAAASEPTNLTPLSDADAATASGASETDAPEMDDVQADVAEPDAPVVDGDRAAEMAAALDAAPVEVTEDVDPYHVQQAADETLMADILEGPLPEEFEDPYGLSEEPVTERA